jgi:hypothetical protein
MLRLAKAKTRTSPVLVKEFYPGSLKDAPHRDYRLGRDLAPFPLEIDNRGEAKLCGVRQLRLVHRQECSRGSTQGRSHRSTIFVDKWVDENYQHFLLIQTGRGCQHASSEKDS